MPDRLVNGRGSSMCLPVAFPAQHHRCLRGAGRRHPITPIGNPVRPNERAPRRGLTAAPHTPVTNRACRGAMQWSVPAVGLRVISSSPARRCWWPQRPSSPASLEDGARPASFGPASSPVPGSAVGDSGTQRPIGQIAAIVGALALLGAGCVFAVHRRRQIAAWQSEPHQDDRPEPARR